MKYCQKIFAFSGVMSDFVDVIQKLRMAPFRLPFDYTNFVCYSVSFNFAASAKSKYYF